MTWNYRVLDHGSYLAIHEVYYGDSPTTNPVPVIGETMEELKATIKQMMEALEKPIWEPTKEVFRVSPSAFNGEGQE
jgi:hypothetical protein